MDLNEFWPENQKPKPDLFDKGAKKWAEETNKDDSNKKKFNEKQNNGSQLRKFFDEILNCKIQQQEKNNNKKNQHGNALDLSIQIKIKMMASKVAYAYGRNNIGDKYKNVFLQGIKKIYTSDDLVYFSDFLECFTGYYRELRPKEK